MTGFPQLGHGIGLRTVHYTDVVEKQPKVDWLEIISENFMVAGGNPRRVLRAVRERYPVVMHGVSMSLGSVDPLNEAYLDDLATLADEIQPEWLSDHLCWASLGGHTGHDLWPLPYTEEALEHLVRRIGKVQERLRRRILLENPSSYLTFAHSTITEWDFLAELSRRADCGLLVDVNDIYVSARNHGFDACQYLDGLPADRVGQIHLAGHSTHEKYLLDTHDHPVSEDVWALYAHALGRFGRISTLIEWDDQIPTLERLVAESERAAAVEAEVLSAKPEVACAQ